MSKKAKDLSVKELDKLFSNQGKKLFSLEDKLHCETYAIVDMLESGDSEEILKYLTMKRIIKFVELKKQVEENTDLNNKIYNRLQAAEASTVEANK